MSDDSKTKTGQFTLDSTQSGAEVPSVTKLLNRKKLIKSDASVQKPAEMEPSVAEISPSIPSEEQSIAVSSYEPLLEIETSQGPSSSAAARPQSAPNALMLKIKPSHRRSGKLENDTLLIWDLLQLQAGGDPLGKGIAVLFEKHHAVCALFLGIEPPASKSGLPRFAARASVMGKERVAIWSGLVWDPTIVPELWNYFVKTGQAELSPPGTMTNVQSNRNVVRAAIGVRSDEWLTLIRIGPPTACRGVLALVTRQSIVNELSSVLTFFTALPTKAAA